MIDTILFDFDGTLMDTKEIIIASWQHTFMTVDGVKRSREEIIATFGEVLQDTIRRYWPDKDTEEIVGIYRSYQKERFTDGIKLFPGILDMLEKFREDGIRMGIVTARTRRSTLAGMDKYGIADMFSAMVTCDDTDEHKPSPVPALMVMEKLGAVPERTVMIGDSRYDMECGKNAGIKTVYAGWQGSASEAELKGMGNPGYVVYSPSEFIKLVKEL